MSDDAPQPTRQALAIEGRSLRGKVTGKLAQAVSYMVWDGLSRKDAATRAGLTDKALYMAFTKPHVMAYYNDLLKVLRTSQRARNVHRLCEIRDAANNIPAVQAIRALEQMDETHGNGVINSAPGLVVNIVTNAEPKVKVIEPLPGEGSDQP